MSTYNDYWSSHAPRATCTVHEEQREALVRYPKPNGGSFTVRVRQMPNAIGFHARLPGGKK